MPSSSTTTYPTRLRQIALLAPTASFPRTKHLLTTIFAAPILFVDPAVGQWGLENFLIPIGGDVIEVVAPLPSHPGRKTTAGRLLEKRGLTDQEGKLVGNDEGRSASGMGYMIIMQTLDAQKRRQEIEAGSRNPPGTSTPAPKVIFSHPFSRTYLDAGDRWKGVRDEGHCIQYHPKGIPGGMMPELDCHDVCAANPDPLGERFSPWHACGADYAGYAAGMKKTGHLRILSVVLRLAPGDEDVAGAVGTWSSLFGVPTPNEKGGNELAFTNCEMSFVKGQQGEKEGLASITMAVEGRRNLEAIADRAKIEGVWVKGNDGEVGGWIEMVGVKWYLVLTEAEEGRLKANL